MTSTRQPFTASTNKLAYAQAFSGASARRRTSQRGRHAFGLRTLGARLGRAK